ncbi:MarR family winged helix-turn-helix transcriptional regulator [Sinomonas sp. ASV486]|uniref:MarR family winged helix-turn-helix transcriptional regulator n=1 Tax=Sinomonas sp. ASV486 TaxID=3051170 RepID=UPI0027DE64A9|nr:MarR family winged helix-turn-helix transcriptional regulator [Sinomonas sp. ASV486]MDQ4491612.1 MarR family winged helix-turn-helix transcriptional regulator [Sinomonas sp. ASV486]
MGDTTPVDIQASTGSEPVELWGRVINGFDVTNRRIQRAIQRELSLNEAEAQVMLNLLRTPDRRAPMAKLARASSFTTGGFTKLADKMARRGLVARAACDDDRRVTFLEFTPEGAKVADDLLRLVERINHEAFIDVLGEDRARQVAQAMTELFRANSEHAS